MRKEIKERIEKIRNGEVPGSFIKRRKKVIPKEWKLVDLKDVALNKGTYGINASSTDFDKTLPRYLRITDITDSGKIDENKKVSVNNDNYIDFILKEGDIVFARTGATVGKSFLYKKEYGELVYAGYLIKFSIDNRKYIPSLLFYYTQTGKYWNWVQTMSMRSGQPGLNAKEYCNLSIPYPPLPEQKKIAYILTTWDKAIEMKQELLEKKKQLKKGLMQRLLTGELRLPGFDGDWKRVSLKKFIRKSNLRNSKEEVKLVLSISNELGFVKQEDYFSKSIASAKTDKYYIITKDQFAYNPSRINVGSIKLLKDYEKGILSPMYEIFSVKKQLSLDFLDYFYDSQLFTKEMNKYLEGSVRQTLKFSKMQEIKINLPPLEEQKAIAEVLSTADKSIELIEKQIENLKLQKKGLMQLLLTGIVRVNDLDIKVN